MNASAFHAAHLSQQPRRRGISPLARRLAQSGTMLLVLALALSLAACDTSGQQSTTRATPGAATETLLTGGGAVRAADGSTLWSQDLGVYPALVAQGVVYSLALDAQHRLPAVRAVRVSDGSTLWTYQPVGCCESLALAGGYVIVAVVQSSKSQPGVGYAGQMALVALRTDTGHVAWQSASISAILLPSVDTPTPFISQLAVSSNRIVGVAADTLDTAYVAAWNLTDGKLAWHAPLDGRADYGAPTLSITPSGAVATAEYGESQKLAAFDLATGKALWHRQLGAGALDATTNGVDVLSDEATGVVTGLRPWDGTTLWQASLGPFSRWQYNVATGADTIYYRTFPADCGLGEGVPTSCTPRLSAISLSSGAVRWQRDLDPIDPEFAITLVAHNSTLYYSYFLSPAQAYMVALATSDGHMIWRHTTDGFLERFIASDDALFAIGRARTSACRAGLESLSARDGSQRWARDFPTCAAPASPGGPEGGWMLLA